MTKLVTANQPTITCEETLSDVRTVAKIQLLKKQSSTSSQTNTATAFYTLNVQNASQKAKQQFRRWKKDKKLT